MLTAVPPDGYATARGTSVAAPFVSATLAWVRTQRPELDHTQLSVEDADDVYRVDLAAGAPLRVELRSHHALDLELWDASTPTTRAAGDVRAAHLLASGPGRRGSQVTVTENRSAGPVTVFVRVRLRPGVARASYALWSS